MTRTIRRLGRVGRLSVAHLRGSLVRTLLLALTVSIGFVVFAVVTALGRASESGLDAAISSDLGHQGSYLMSVETAGSTEVEVATRVALDALVPRAVSVLVLADYSTVDASCPSLPGRRDEAPRLVVLLGRYGHESQPTDPRSAGSARDVSLAATGELCLGGVTMPTTTWPAVPLPSAITGGQPFAVAPAGLATEVQLQMGAPPRVIVLAATGSPIDETSSLRSLLEGALRRSGDRWSASPPTVDRLDSGAATRNAANGVRAVYGIVAWSVLGLGGLGLLVAELMGAKSRIWFFGLARVVGATSADLALLVIADVAVIVTAGALAAAGIVAAVSSPASAWANETLDVSIELVSPTTVRQLALGAIGVALLGAVAPAWRASRTDPIVAIESSGA